MQFGLRQLDLSLLSQLWALNDSIQEFRTLIEERDAEQEDEEEEEDYGEGDEEEDDLPDETHLKPHNIDLQTEDLQQKELSAKRSRCSSSYKPMLSTDVDNIVKSQSNGKPATTGSVMGKKTVITTQPRLCSQSPSNVNNKITVSTSSGISSIPGTTLSKAQVLTSIEGIKPVPRMRSAPPPPPNGAAPRRQLPTIAMEKAT